MLPLLCVLSVLPAASVAPSKPADPSKAPPKIMVANVQKDGRAYLQAHVSRIVPVTRQISVQVNGKTEVRQVTSYMYVTETRNIFLDDKGVTLYGSDGKKLDAKNLPKLLPETAPVLVSADGKKVDPFYLQLARRGTVVVVCPLLAPPNGPQVVPAPAPRAVVPPKKTP